MTAETQAQPIARLSRELGDSGTKEILPPTERNLTMLSEGKLEELEKVAKAAEPLDEEYDESTPDELAAVELFGATFTPPTVLALISELRALRAERGSAAMEVPARLEMPNGDVLTRRGSYWDLRTPADAYATNQEGWELVEQYGLDALLLAALRAQVPAPVAEAMRREHTLAQIPALIMANIEEVPDWQCSAPLVTAHCHASVLHEDLPDALISPAPVGGEVVNPEFTRELAGTLRTIAGEAEGYINFSCEVRRKSSVVMMAANILERYAAVSPDPTEGGEDE